MDKKFNAAQQEAWVYWIRTSQLVMERVEHALKASGFPPLVWYDALLELDTAKGGKLRLIELGERMLLKKFNVTRLIDRMESEGYVQRVVCDNDARGTYATITPAGKKLRRTMWPVYYDAVSEYFLKDLNDKEVKTFSKILKKIHNNREIE